MTCKLDANDIHERKRPIYAKLYSHALGVPEWYVETLYSLWCLLSILSLVYSFTEMAGYLLTLKGVEFLLNEKFNQDPLEIYFSKQRSRGARGDNPSVHQCLQNAQAIRAAKTLTLGNCNIRK